MQPQPEGGDSLAPDAGFEDFLKAALQDIPPDIADQLKTGLLKRYNKPPLEELELCLGRNVPLQKARQILFAPEEEDMRLYPALIAMPPPGAPDNHPQRSVQVCALASLYLVHSRSWERVRPFIEAGGLRQLVTALSHPNPYLASQAMSALLHLTDEEAVFPWHDPPAAADGRGPREGPYALVWRRMYDLSRGGLLISQLLAHRRTPPAFPGAPDMALRLLAFYLSWLRKHFTQDGRLSLSQGLLDLLQRWGQDPAAGQEERQLAEQLHRDFSRFPPAQEPPAAAPTAGAAAGEDASAGNREQQQTYLGGLSGGEEDDGYEVRVVSERTEVNSGPSRDNEAEVLKEQGNAAFRRGDFTSAIHLYSAALDVPVPAEGPRILSEGPRRAAYHANRAAAYMGRAAAAGQLLREGESDTAGHLEGLDLGSHDAVSRHFQAAIIDCDMALDLDPVGAAAAKTCLRKCRALRRLGRVEEAAAAARAALAKHDSSGG
ncbi:hypothetical protein Agub_g7052, partial [Astrephomene gubernaculifera]